MYAELKIRGGPCTVYCGELRDAILILKQSLVSLGISSHTWHVPLRLNKALCPGNRNKTELHCLHFYRHAPYTYTCMSLRHNAEGTTKRREAAMPRLSTIDMNMAIPPHSVSREQACAGMPGTGRKGGGGGKSRLTTNPPLPLCCGNVAGSTKADAPDAEARAARKWKHGGPPAAIDFKGLGHRCASVGDFASPVGRGFWDACEPGGVD